jgi:hypothetical protein
VIHVVFGYLNSIVIAEAIVMLMDKEPRRVVIVKLAGI